MKNYTKKWIRNHGKDLSENDFTNQYKEKLDNLQNYNDADIIKQLTNFNERANSLEETNSAIKTNVDALQTDNENNKTDITKLKETTSKNAEKIEEIKKEQTTQNEKIEQNTNDIQQNKAETDEEIAKLKEENKLLKAQIPEGQASGNDIHIEDSSNMEFEWKLNGGSRQEVKPYNNLVKNADFSADLNEWKAGSKFSIVNQNGIRYLKLSADEKRLLQSISNLKYYCKS